ncbi:MAG TPA: histidine kinase [Candidatus Pelethocola excrementipullorum]|nr:histidine kinase [Candidatus Pelethocola excrementipullorum]
MIKKLTSGYYSRMLLICIVTVCTVTGALFLLSSSLIRTQERNEYLKNYDIEINNLSSILSTKQNAMANTLAPVFNSASRYQELCRLYQEGGPLDSAANYSIVQMLSEICRYDQYCRGILLLTEQGQLYQYNIRYDTIVSLPLNQTDLAFTPYQLQILSDTQLEDLSDEYEKPADHVYGLVGTIYDYFGEDLLPFGQIIILYATSEFTNSITDAHLDESGLFTLTDTKKNIIYSSDGNYEASENLIFPDFSSEGSNTVQIPASTITQDDTKYYHASAYNGKYEYYTNYQIPANLIQISYIQVVLAVLALFICLASILLYVVTLRMSGKKIKTIQAGMSLVGQNNLDYRLHVPKSNDEFTQIINSFNGMCDELQRNVEKAYLYEISQKKAELYAMQTSINPHFLYNTLEQIRVQIMKGCYSDASQMLLLLSKLYRNQTRRNLYVSIGEELNLCENLINLYMYRYGNFDYEFIIGNALKIYGIPKNTLQPLIENYFVHGLVQDREDNLLSVSVQLVKDQEKEYLEFHIDDNGTSILPEDLKVLEEKLSQPVLSRNEDNGFALSNVNTRLKLVFGEDAGLKASVGNGGSGFRIAFRIPPILPENLQ